jgi:hypothetical protein
MKLFKDNAGREWTVKIDGNSLRRVRDLLNVNLADFLAIDALTRRLRSDELFVIDVAWALCQPQAAERQLTCEQFTEAMGGDANQGAYTAITEDLPDFFRDPTTRKIVAESVKRKNDLMNEIHRLSRSTSGSSTTESGASSDSTPTTSPSASS